MREILQPDNSSRENLEVFLDTIQDEEIRNLLKQHLEGILEVGRIGSGRESQAQRDSFFADVEALIATRLEGGHEDPGDPDKRLPGDTSC